MTRIALGLQYDGAAFNGWQTQTHGNTVQDHLEAGLRAFTGGEIGVTVAGRTDTGVHALGQVAHFDTDLVRPLTAWVRGLNAFLPETIVVQWAQEVDAEFHARFVAFERTYYYALYTGPIRPPLLMQRAGYLLLPPGEVLQLEAMQKAAQYLVGEHDFSSFRAAGCQAKSPVKTMHEITVIGQGQWVFVRLRGNAFLHHMVRNIMGCLVAIGRGRETPDWMQTVLAARSRTIAAPTFMPDGLYLANVAYPAPYVLPAPNLSASLFHGVFV